MIILGTNSIKDTGFDVANSLRFDDGSSDYLNRTQSTSPTNSKKGTISFWVKRGALGDQHILNGYTDTNNRAFLNFTSDDRLQVGQKNSGTTVYQIQETAQRRDVSAWYNCIFAFDTTDATASNRLKLYVNGSQVTDFTTNNEIEVNEDIKLFNLANLQLGRAGGGSNYFDGYLAEFVYVDGSQLGADSFGEFDDSGIWKPIDISGLTFGNNGFYLENKQSGTGTNSSGMGADTSGNDFHFAVTNFTAQDQSTDTCTNNFATINSLDNFYANSTFSEGNLKIVTSSNETYNTSTIGVSSGKWYFEVEWDATSSGTSVVGIVDSPSSATSASLHKQSKGWGYRDGGDVKNNDSAVSGSWSSYTTGDIIGIALDLDNNRLFFSKNGSFQNSGDPTSSTGAITITAPSSLTNGTYFFAIGDYNSGTTTLLANFGSPPFAISSGNTDGNGYGNFEYAVPSGYFALNTKNLAEYGG